jgi:hypothetical protein
MQLVLVAGFNPRVSKLGPKVRLYEGNWRICMEHHVDSELVLHTQCGKVVPLTHGLVIISDGTVVHLGIAKTGSESFINVFAEHVRNGSNPSKSS